MAATYVCIHSLSNSLRQNQSMTFHPTSAVVNPQTPRLCFYPIIPNTLKFSSATATTNSARKWRMEAQTVCSTNGNRVFEGNDGYNEDERSWEKEAWAVRSGNTTRVKDSHEFELGRSICLSENLIIFRVNWNWGFERGSCICFSENMRGRNAQADRT